MNLYYIAPTYNYFDKIANFIIQNFSKDFSNLKIILPNGLYCSKLQEILVRKLKISILPSIVSINNIPPNEEAIFNLTIDKLRVPTLIEERIILTDIIKSYKKLKFDIIQSVNLTGTLSKFFYDITLRNITLEQINNIANFNQSEHWQFIYNFLSYAYLKWQRAIKLAKKTDRANFYKNNLINELQVVKNNKNEILVAGVIGTELNTWNFLYDIANLSNGTVILPPLNNNEEVSEVVLNQSLSPEHPLYCYHKFLHSFKILPSQIKNLIKKDACEQNYLLELVTSQHSNLKNKISIDKKFSYYQYETVYCEAESLALMCLEDIKTKANIKIAVITNDYSLLNIYQNFFRKFNLDFTNYLGEDILKLNIFSFIYELSIFCCNEFNLSQLIIVLKNPLIFNPYVLKLEQIVIKKNRFVTSFAQIEELLKKNEDLEFYNWINNIKYSLEIKFESNMNQILKQILLVAQILVPKIWIGNEAKILSDILYEIISLNWRINLNNLSEFPDILKYLIHGIRINNKLQNTNIVFCSPGEAILLKFDKIYLMNFNDNVWPKKVQNNLWFNRQMENDLDFHIDKIREGQNFYDYYLLLHNNEIVFSRAKKINSKEFLVSNYFLKLQYLLNVYHQNIMHNLNNLNDVLQIKYNQINYAIHNKVLSAKTTKFPTQISATDINLLVKSPYDFYVKKILKLKPQIALNDKPQAFEFGIIMHKIIEIYTNNYSKNSLDNLIKNFITIAFDVIQNSIFRPLNQKLWQIKMKALAKEFVEFDEKSRVEAKTILAEVKGEMLINIYNQKIKLTAIADRIDIGYDNKITIFDYKTGVVPSLKDISQGLAPQLLIEALIVKLGKFDSVESKIVSQICYIKISNSKPYINVTKIDINDEILNNHLKGLSALLKYYLDKGEFQIELDLLKYQIYDHLARVRLKS